MFIVSSDPIRNSCLSDCYAIIEESFEMNIVLLLWTFLISDMMHTLSEYCKSCHTSVYKHMLSMERKQVGAMCLSASILYAYKYMRKRTKNVRAKREEMSSLMTFKGKIYSKNRSYHLTYWC